MKFVALLLGLAIVSVLVVKRAQPSQVAEAMQEADAVVQPVTVAPASTATPSQSATGLRAPLDRTRFTLDEVKQRNGGDEF